MHLVGTLIWLHTFSSATLYTYVVSITLKLFGSFCMCFYCRKDPGITWIIVIDLVQQANVKEKWLITGSSSPIPIWRKMALVWRCCSSLSALWISDLLSCRQCVHGCQSQWVASCGTSRWALCENEGICSEQGMPFLPLTSFLSLVFVSCQIWKLAKLVVVACIMLQPILCLVVWMICYWLVDLLCKDLYTRLVSLWKRVQPP